LTFSATNHLFRLFFAVLSLRLGRIAPPQFHAMSLIQHPISINCNRFKREPNWLASLNRVGKPDCQTASKYEGPLATSSTQAAHLAVRPTTLAPEDALKG